MSGRAFSFLGLLVSAVLVTGLLAVPARAEEPVDPYASIARGTALMPNPSAATVLAKAAPACPRTCFQLRWVRLANVIDVSGTGFAGVEGATAGVLVDPLDGRRKIYVSHGHSLGDTSALRVYDIVNDAWFLGPNASVVRSEGSGTAVGNRLFALGGRPAIGAVEIFDPVGGGFWTSGSPMMTPRSGLGVAALQGKIFAVGGRLGSSPLDGPGLATNEVYNPSTDSWMAKAPMPVPLGDVYATVALGDRLHVFGGWDGIQNTAFTQVYDPAVDAWTLHTPMPTPRSNALAGVLAGRALVIGGLASPFGVNSSMVEVYDPVFDTWCTGPAKPTPASEIASTGANTPGVIYAVGSGSFGLSSSIHEALVLRKVDCFCPRTQGYWKNHRRFWPLRDLALGAWTYNQAELLRLLRTPVRGDASLILARQLIAAKLNYAAGSDRPDEITATILDADGLLAMPGALPFGIKTSTPLGRSMVAAAEILNRFNNGPVGPGCR